MSVEQYENTANNVPTRLSIGFKSYVKSVEHAGSEKHGDRISILKLNNYTLTRDLSDTFQVGTMILQPNAPPLLYEYLFLLHLCSSEMRMVTQFPNGFHNQAQVGWSIFNQHGNMNSNAMMQVHHHQLRYFGT